MMSPRCIIEWLKLFVCFSLHHRGVALLRLFSACYLGRSKFLRAANPQSSCPPPPSPSGGGGLVAR